MKWFDNQKSNNINSSVLPFELHRVSENTYDEIVKRQDGYYLIKRCGTMPYSGVHNHTEFVTDGYTLVYALPRSQQQEIKLDWTPPKTHGDSTTFIVNSGGAIPEIEGTLAIDRRYVEWREDKQGQTIAVAPLNIDYNRKAYIDKIYGDEQQVGELVVDDEGNESYELAINTVEFPSLKTYDGVTHVSSHGETLSPHMEIQAKQMINGEEVLSSFEGKNITVSDSTVGEIESATLYGETLVNAIKEPRAEVVLPYSFEDGENVTIENTKATGSLEGIVLKGKTLVNHCPDSIYIADGWTTGGYKQFDNFPTLVKGKTYTFYAPIGSKEGNAGDSVVDLKITTDGTAKSIYSTWGNSHGTIFKTFTMGDRLWFNNYAITGTRFQQNYPTVMILEGEWTQESMPEYFKGIASCKMPILTTSTFIPMYSFLKDDGKENFTKLYTEFYEVTKDTFTFKQSGHYQEIFITTDNFEKEGKQTLELNKPYQFKIEILKNTLSIDMEIRCNTKFTDGVTRIVRAGETPIYEFSKTITSEIPEDNVHGAGEMIVFSLPSGYNGEISFKVTIGDGNINNIKSTILSTPEEVVLHGIGDNQDTLNCYTGELTTKFLESPDFTNYNFPSFTQHDSTSQSSASVYKASFKLPFPCVDIPYGATNPETHLAQNISVRGDANGYDANRGTYVSCRNQEMFVHIIKDENGKPNSLESLREYLVANDIKVLFPLAKNIVKKVDLSIIDQNGVKKDKLQTFDGVTHLSVSTPDGSLNPIITSKFEIPVNIKPNTQYSIIKDSYTNGHDNVPFTLDLGGTEVSSQIGERVTLVTTPNTLTHKSLKPSGWGQKLTNLMVIEGDLTGSDIPYIEGMQSVRMPVLTTIGKNQTYPILGGDINSNEYNLMNLTDENYNTNNKLNTAKAIKWVDNETFHIKGYGIDQYDNQYNIPLKPSLLKPNQKYRVSFKEISGAHERNDDLLTLERFLIYINRKTVLTATQNNPVATFTTPDDIRELAFNIWLSGKKTKSDVIYAIFKEFMIEELENEQQPISYEPYKSNILTVNEDVELRGIGDVKDTLNYCTGELTERIGEVVLDENVVGNNGAIHGTMRRFDLILDKPISQKIISDKLPTGAWNVDIRLDTAYEFVAYYNPTTLLVAVESSKLSTQDLNGLRLYLQSNPIRIQYIVEEPIVKNVVIGNGEDLSLDETRVKLPRPLGKDEALEWNGSANHYQIIRYEDGIKSAVEDCKELFNRYVVSLRDKVKTFVTSKASKLLLDLPYRKVRELTVPDNFTVVLDNENDLVTMSWDEVVGATDYDIYLDGAFLTRVNTNQYQRREEIKGHLKVRAVNDLTMSDFTEETYVLSVPNETFISLVENRYEGGHVFTVTFADYSEIETGFRVRWSPDGREESYADVAGVAGKGTIIKHTFTVPLIHDYIDIRVNSYNDTGENPIVPPIHLEVSPTPIWTYKETMGQVMLQWSNTIDNTEHYVLKYKIEGTSDYVYETILSDGYDTITGYIDLGEDDLAEVSIAGVVDGLTHVYCKPFKVGKSVDETLLPPQNFTYRAISENEFEFSWTDSYTCEREFELILSHSDGRIERIIVPSTSSSTTGRKYTYRYKLQEYGYFGVKLRMNWELGNSAYTQEYTIYYLPTVVEPPAYIRKERRENEVSLQWEAQSFVDYYALYLSINGDEVEYEVKNNHYEFRINFEEEPEIRAYIRTHFLDGKVSSSSSVLQFRPCYSPNPYMVTIVNVVTEEKVLDCNIISPEIVQDYPLYTGSISKTEVSYPVSMSSVTKFTMVELPMTSEFWGKSLETDGHILSYVCRSNVEQSRYPLNVLTYKPTENIIPILETTILNYVYEAPITTEINRVRITTIGDSITAGHPNYWAETGTGDVRSQYQYWLNRKLNGQFEIINKGYGSDTTDKMVARFDKDVLETYPQYCIIQGGTNDLM